jgi:hypothetical protein
VDIARGAAFCFLRSVWGCMVFFAFAFGVCGECCCGPERFFLGRCQYGYRGDAGFCAGFGVRWCRLSEVPLTEVKSKETTKKCTKTKILKIRIVFWLWLFLGAFVWAGIDEFGIGVGFCVFLCPCWCSSGGKIFGSWWRFLHALGADAGEAVRFRAFGGE